ncbi:MAG: bacteriohemerythrin, partial [Magnetococcales bacterium]|nr:bacteriohemerythrin [Magnetococcales bacterium]
EGDGWDANRPTMSSILTYQNRIYLIDAGPNLVYTLTALGIGIEQVDGLFHTHAHDDHFAGLTALMRSGRRIKYFATPLVRASVAKKLAALLDMDEANFADFVTVHDLTCDSWNDIEGLEVMPIFSPHPVETTVLVFRTLSGDGYHTYGHFADIVSLDVLKGMITDQDDAPGLSRKAFDMVRQSYLIPVDVKKLDVGGGMIHGSAKDFKSDASGRILLAHRATELTAEEKEIGSSAAFGTSDILVEGLGDSLRRQAYSHLEAHLGNVPAHHLRTLINHPLVEINPGSIVLKKGEIPSHVYLLVTGRVEKIRTQSNLLVTLSAGALIGDTSGLERRPSGHTYRASSFVRALRLTVSLYCEIIRSNGLLERMRHAAVMRSFLESTTLFGEGVPAATLSRIIDAATEHRLAMSETINCRSLSTLNIIRSGRLERSVGDTVLDTLLPLDFFGEEGALFKIPCMFRMRVLEDTTVITIPGHLLEEIPIVRWKLLESYRRRAACVLHSGNEKGVFAWRDEFTVHVTQMDIHHHRLVEIANAVIESLRQNDRLFLAKALDALVDYTRYHFEAEEQLMFLYGYPDASSHRETHQDLIAQVVEFQKQEKAKSTSDVGAFRHFFESWLVRHVLEEDRRYGEFLNAKGLY